MRGLGKHIAILVVLVVISIVLAVTKESGGKSASNAYLFTLTDTTLVESIEIMQPDDTILVERKSDGWSLNDTLSIDPSLIKIFNALMSQVEVTRPISQLNYEETKIEMLNRGQRVSISIGGDKRIFYVGGNTKKTQSYFADESLENIYLVGIPGYQNYLSGIFELTTNQWRERMLFASGWRTIQNLTIDYEKKNDLEIFFQDRSMQVRGVNKLDTAKLMGYLQQYENFQLNDYLEPNQFPRYDSLMSVEPLARIRLKDIDKERNRSLTVYPKIPGERFVLFTDHNDQMIVVDEQRTLDLLKSANYFIKK